jgi:hypothetical protein
VAPLLAVVTGFAGWAGADRDVASPDSLRDNGFGGFDRGGVAAGPRGLSRQLRAIITQMRQVAAKATELTTKEVKNKSSKVLSQAKDADSKSAFPAPSATVCRVTGRRSPLPNGSNKMGDRRRRRRSMHESHPVQMDKDSQARSHLRSLRRDRAPQRGEPTRLLGLSAR